MKFFSRKKPLSALDRLRGAGWKCASCALTHKGMFHLASFAPDFWEGPEEYEPNGAIRFDGDFLSEDFCVVGGEHFFVRCVFDIPVHGLAEKFGFGVWSTLSRANFDLYLDGFDEGAYANLGPWTGWFSNRLTPFGDTLNQPCWVHPQLARQRPVITLANEEHDLARAQAEGITPERVLELYAACGHVVDQVSVASVTKCILTDIPDLARAAGAVTGEMLARDRGPGFQRSKSVAQPVAVRPRWPVALCHFMLSQGVSGTPY